MRKAVSINTAFQPFKVEWLIYLPPGLRLKIMHCADTVNVYVLYASHNKQRLFHYTAFTGCFFYNLDRTCLQRGTDCVLKCDGVTLIL